MALGDTLKKNLNIITGKVPQSIEDAEAYTEQNPEVFNLANEPDDDGHVMSESVEADGSDPFYGVQSVQGQDEELPFYPENEKLHSVEVLQRRPSIAVMSVPSGSWQPRTISLASALAILLDAYDPERLRITVINTSAQPIVLSKDPAAGINGITIPANTSITIATCDYVYASCSQASAGSPVTFSYFTERGN